MKINIICFSQTGNTRKVGRAMAAVFDEKGHEVEFVFFKKAEPNHFTSADIVGVGAPCFESQAPTPVRAFLKELPHLEGKKAFVFATAGGGPGRVLYDLAKPLMAKKAEVVGGFLARGTCYHPVPCLVNRFPGRPAEDDLEAARGFAESVADHAASGRSGPLPETRPDALKHGFGFYHIAAILLKDPLVRFLMPRPQVVDPGKCNQCQWCVHECPTGSITLEPAFRIASTCIRCYRCLNGCPEDALSVKWGISNFMVWTIYNKAFERWLGDVKAGETVYGSG